MFHYAQCYISLLFFIILDKIYFYQSKIYQIYFYNLHKLNCIMAR